MKDKINKILSIILFVLLIILIADKFNGNKIEKFFNSDFKKTNEITAEPLNDSRELEINDLIDFNNKSKNEIFEIRKKFVKKSIFNSKNYKPSEEVFGGIQDYKPWIGINSTSCGWSNSAPQFGLSEESRFINNPNALIMLNMPWKTTKARTCEKNAYLLPASIEYIKSRNTIIVKYKMKQFRDGIYQKYYYEKHFMLDAINARDLGYNWGYAHESKGVTFYKPSILNEAYQFRDFIHLGGSCGVEGGCNNGSPYQQELNFAIIKHNAYVKLYLWKNAPNNKKNKADINYELHFDEI